MEMDMLLDIFLGLLTITPARILPTGVYQMWL